MNDRKPRAPSGLGSGGRKFWSTMHETFDFTDEPQKIAVLERACRAIDRIEQLDAAMLEQPLLVTGSSKQMVINPLISESRQQAALVATLLGKLGLPDADPEVALRQLKRTQASAKALRARHSV